ncbi:hypothetical protein BH11BAC2_BH11BAC2_12600 [soil metagenome]
MKKVSGIILLLFFLISNSGIALNIHTCGGKITSISLFSNTKNRCACGKKVMKANCCKDKTVQVKAKTETAKISQFTFNNCCSKTDLTLIDNNELKIPILNNYSSFHFYHPPPLKFKRAIFILDCSFLI